MASLPFLLPATDPPKPVVNYNSHGWVGGKVGVLISIDKDTHSWSRRALRRISPPCFLSKEKLLMWPQCWWPWEEAAPSLYSRSGCITSPPKQKDLCTSRIAPVEEKEHIEHGWEGQSWIGGGVRAKVWRTNRNSPWGVTGRQWGCSRVFLRIRKGGQPIASWAGPVGLLSRTTETPALFIHCLRHRTEWCHKYVALLPTWLANVSMCAARKNKLCPCKLGPVCQNSAA